MTAIAFPAAAASTTANPSASPSTARPAPALAGDTLASALLANGVHLMGRSFKYHRPRGVVSAGSDEPNALMGTRRGPGRFEPNTRATIQELRDRRGATTPRSPRTPPGPRSTEAAEGAGRQAGQGCRPWVEESEIK